MYVVYALIDPCDHQVHYVGLTDNVYERFRQHVYGKDDNPAKCAWLHELREANVMVIMQALETLEGLEQAKKREAYWIQHYHQLGAHLTNKIIPLHHEIVYVRTEYPAPEIRLGPRMTPNEQRQYVVKRWSMGVSRKTILAQVSKYIPMELTNLVVDECESPKVLVGATRHNEVPTFSAQEQRIIKKFMGMDGEALGIGQIVASEFTNTKGEPLTDGNLYRQRSKDVQDVLRRYISGEAS